MKQDKTKPIFGLKKIPNYILLKMSLVENGKLKAYIDELEYENAKLKQQISDLTTDMTDDEKQQIKSQVRKEKEYKELRTINKDLWERNKTLKNRLDTLLAKMLKEEHMAKCFFCGHELLWNNDWNLSDVEGTEDNGEGDGVVTSYTCPECGAEYTVTQRNCKEEKAAKKGM